MRSAVALVLGLALGATLMWAMKAGPTLCLADITLTDALQNAGSADYAFTLPSKTILILRVEHGTADAAVFDGFLLPAVDGPAEVDPARIGRHFRLCFENPLRISEVSGR